MAVHVNNPLMIGCRREAEYRAMGDVVGTQSQRQVGELACCGIACRKTEPFSQAKWINRLLVVEGDSRPRGRHNQRNIRARAFDSPGTKLVSAACQGSIVSGQSSAMKSSDQSLPDIGPNCLSASCSLNAIHAARGGWTVSGFGSPIQYRASRFRIRLWEARTEPTQRPVQSQRSVAFSDLEPRFPLGGRLRLRKVLAPLGRANAYR